tara:strand:- start:13282 stop:15087 length:1806 start_codon:yes stop_codon:yes gene_type:complete
MKFQNIGLHTNIKKAVADLNFKILTPVQQQVIPYLLENENDLIALAQTGTGKTAAFGLPILHKIEIERKLPQAIILCPTRELCLQITKDMSSYSKYMKAIKITAVYGGSNITTQIKSLKSGTHIVVGTPGRVIDLINRKSLRLKDIEFVILDEADEMLNMGFKDDLDTILVETPEAKQTLLFSATMPKEVMRISKNYMFNPKTIEIARRNEGAKNVQHHYYMVSARDKYPALRRICDVIPNIYGIVFCRTRRETASIADKLIQDGYNADAIHGELSQAQRNHVMTRFRKKKLQILVATDVASRGIDINELTHVINYNLPDDNEVYVHRSGRTGRADNKGVSIIIAHSRDGRKLKAIERMIKHELILKKIPNGNEICQIQLIKLIDKVVKSKINHQIEKYIPSIEEKLSHLNKEELIKHFVSAEFNRFLSFYKNAPDLNISSSSKNERSQRGDRKNKREKIPGHAELGYTRFFINLGKEKGLQTHNLIGLINEYTKDKKIPIGKIDIMRKFSFFEIPSDYEKIILSSFRKVNWKGNSVNIEISQTPKPKSVRNNIRDKKKDRKKSIKRTKERSKAKSKERISKKSNLSSFKDRFNAAAKRKN